MHYLTRLKIILWSNKIFIIIGLIVLIYVLVFTKFIEYKSKIKNNEKEYIGKVEKYSYDGNKLSLEIKGKEKVIANYYFEKEEEKNKYFKNIHLGDTIKIIGTIKEVSNNTIFNEFNYKKYLYNKKIYKEINIDRLEVIKKGNILYKIKDKLLKRSYKFANKAYYLTFIFGDKSNMNSDTINSYIKNGTSHLLAISGMHLHVFMLFIILFIKKFRFLTRLIFLTIFFSFFLFLTNYGASILRAIIFTLLLMIKNEYNLRLTNIHILLITAFIILLIDPFMIYDLGFIYSFVVTFGILYYNKFIKGNYLKKLLIISLISFFFSFPITALVNYQINLFSIIANLIYVPLISFIIYPLTLISYIFSCLEPILSLFLSLNNILGNIFEVLEVIIVIPKIPIAVVIIYYYLLLTINNKRKFIVFFIVLLFIIKIIPKINNGSEVIYLDVGQGDSTIIIAPHQKKVVLVDTGGKIKYKEEKWQERAKKYNLSSRTIKYLNSKGISKIDYLILTHGDYDHIGEAINLVNNFKVEKVIFNCGSFNDLEKKLIKDLNKKNIKYYACIKGINIANNELHFLNTKENDNENDNSNVIYTKLYNYKFLFMGDAGNTCEKDIIDKYNLDEIDFLKVGHHGSNTSSSKYFIDKIKPKNSIISVGKNNRYNHPKDEVLETLSNSKIYRTDIDGSIEIKLNKYGYKIRTCPP